MHAMYKPLLRVTYSASYIPKLSKKPLPCLLALRALSSLSWDLRRRGSLQRLQRSSRPSGQAPSRHAAVAAAAEAAAASL